MEGHSVMLHPSMSKLLNCKFPDTQLSDLEGKTAQMHPNASLTLGNFIS